MALARVLGALFLVAGLYCGIDPLNHRAMSGFLDFETHLVPLPPWSELPAERDRQNSLQRSEVRFLNQVQGPESVAFDARGRGPYIGVADGRVLFWDGHAWTEFATSRNRISKIGLDDFLVNLVVIREYELYMFDKRPEPYSLIGCGILINLLPLIAVVDGGDEGVPRQQEAQPQREVDQVHQLERVLRDLRRRRFRRREEWLGVGLTHRSRDWRVFFGFGVGFLGLLELDGR